MPQGGLDPGRQFDLSALREIGAAGSPLPPEGFEWIFEQLGPSVCSIVGSGGTDVCTGIVPGARCSPSTRARCRGAASAVDAAAYDLDGKPVVGELGELVIRQPMPSMPVGFWNDPDGAATAPPTSSTTPASGGTATGCCSPSAAARVITGRSDATLNRGGVRLGTGELYAVVEEIPEVADSLVVHLEDPDGGPGS